MELNNLAEEIEVRVRDGCRLCENGGNYVGGQVFKTTRERLPNIADMVEIVPKHKPVEERVIPVRTTAILESEGGPEFSPTSSNSNIPKPDLNKLTQPREAPEEETEEVEEEHEIEEPAEEPHKAPVKKMVKKIVKKVVKRK